MSRNSLRVLTAGAAILTMVGCAASRGAAPEPGMASASPEATRENAQTLWPAVAGATGTEQARAHVNRERVHALWAERTQGGVPVEVCLGPGDLLEISVFRLEEMQAMRTRVSSAGIVSLPLIGEIHAAGMTQPELVDEIARRLRAGYLRDPQVTVFVTEFASQQVSVTGGVTKPGLYSLNRDNRTLADMIAEAGGLSDDAGGKILFYPSTGSVCPGRDGVPFGQVAASRLRQGTPIEIDTNEDPVAAYGDLRQNPLRLPMIGGDSLVANRGQFLVEGWVEKPGAFPISPGITAFGGLSAAGGPSFPAHLSGITLWRAQPSGVKQRIDVDIKAIEAGTQKDVTLQAGDVIKVPASPVKMVPYTVYWLLTNVFRVGAGLSLTGF